MILDPLFWADILRGTFRNATPLVYGTVGETYTERSGVLNLGIEGTMYAGAFFGFAVAFFAADAGAGVAAPWIGVVGAIVVGLAAKRETVWATRLTYMDGSFTVEGTPRLTDTLDLEGVAAVLADEHLPQRMREAAGDARVPVIEPVLRGAACAAIAQRMLDSGRVTDAFVLGPIYPRPPEAVVRWDGRRKGR